MTTQTAIFQHSLRDMSVDDIGDVSASLRFESESFSGTRFRVLDLVGSCDGRIIVHESDLMSLSGILRDMLAYGATIDDEDDHYYWRDEVSGLESVCRLEGHHVRIVLNHWTEYDAEKRNFLTLTPMMARNLIEIIETMLAVIVYNDMMNA